METPKGGFRALDAFATAGLMLGTYGQRTLITSASLPCNTLGI